MRFPAQFSIPREHLFSANYDRSWVISTLIVYLSMSLRPTAEALASLDLDASPSYFTIPELPPADVESPSGQVTGTNTHTTIRGPVQAGGAGPPGRVTALWGILHSLYQASTLLRTPVPMGETSIRATRLEDTLSPVHPDESPIFCSGK